MSKTKKVVAEAQPSTKTESMTAAEAQQVWQDLSVQDRGSNPGLTVNVNGTDIVSVQRGYEGVIFVYAAGKDRDVLDPAEKVTVKWTPRENVENAEGELEG